MLNLLNVLTLGWCRACQCYTVCLWLQRISICKQKRADFKANKRKNNLTFYNWKERALKRDRMWPIQLIRIREKGRKHKQIELKLRETSLTDVTNSHCWTWQEKVFKFKYKEASSFNARLTVRLLTFDLKAPAWNQTIFTPFHWLKRPTWR